MALVGSCLSGVAFLGVLVPRRVEARVTGVRMSVVGDWCSLAVMARGCSALGTAGIQRDVLEIHTELDVTHRPHGVPQRQL
jgi:hypothetical protein